MAGHRRAPRRLPKNSFFRNGAYRRSYRRSAKLPIPKASERHNKGLRGLRNELSAGFQKAVADIGHEFDGVFRVKTETAHGLTDQYVAELGQLDVFGIRADQRDFVPETIQFDQLLSHIAYGAEFDRVTWRAPACTAKKESKPVPAPRSTTVSPGSTVCWMARRKASHRTLSSSMRLCAAGSENQSEVCSGVTTSANNPLCAAGRPDSHGCAYIGV
jgi:hypothetical protein